VRQKDIRKGEMYLGRDGKVRVVEWLLLYEHAIGHPQKPGVYYSQEVGPVVRGVRRSSLKRFAAWAERTTCWSELDELRREYRRKATRS